MNQRKKSGMLLSAMAGLTVAGVASAGPILICPIWDLEIGQPGAVGGSVSAVERIGDEVRFLIRKKA